MAFKDTTERNAMNYYISDLHIGHENRSRQDLCANLFAGSG